MGVREDSIVWRWRETEKRRLLPVRILKSLSFFSNTVICIFFLTWKHWLFYYLGYLLYLYKNKFFPCKSVTKRLLISRCKWARFSLIYWELRPDKNNYVKVGVKFLGLALWDSLFPKAQVLQLVKTSLCILICSPQICILIFYLCLISNNVRGLEGGAFGK